MPRVIIIAGIPGVGKSTVLNDLEKIARNMKKNIRIVNYGTIMLDLLKKKGLALDRDHIRKQPIHIQRLIQAEAAKEIARLKDDVVLVDTHMIIKTDKGYLAGIPKHVLDELNPEMIILVEAMPEEVVARRTKDLTRIREADVSQVKEEIEFSRYYASSCSNLSGAPLKIILNREGRSKEAAEEILKLI